MRTQVLVETMETTKERNDGKVTVETERKELIEWAPFWDPFSGVRVAA